MKNINKNLLKRVHSKILQKGKKLNEKHHFLAGLYAYQESDECMLFISDAYNFVKLDFNGEFQFSYVSKDYDKSFNRKIKQLDSMY